MNQISCMSYQDAASTLPTVSARDMRIACEASYRSYMDGSINWIDPTTESGANGFLFDRSYQRLKQDGKSIGRSGRNPNDVLLHQLLHSVDPVMTLSIDQDGKDEHVVEGGDPKVGQEKASRSHISVAKVAGKKRGRRSLARTKNVLLGKRVLRSSDAKYKDALHGETMHQLEMQAKRTQKTELARLLQARKEIGRGGC